MPDDAVTLDYVVDKLVIWGSPERVADELLAFREEVGDFGTLLYAGKDWLDRDLGRRSMVLMAEKVMPAVNAAIGAPGVGIVFWNACLASPLGRGREAMTTAAYADVGQWLFHQDAAVSLGRTVRSCLAKDEASSAIVPEAPSTRRDLSGERDVRLRGRHVTAPAPPSSPASRTRRRCPRRRGPRLGWLSCSVVARPNSGVGQPRSEAKSPITVRSFFHVVERMVAGR